MPVWQPWWGRQRQQRRRAGKPPVVPLLDGGQHRNRRSAAGQLALRRPIQAARNSPDVGGVLWGAIAADKIAKGGQDRLGNGGGKRPLENIDRLEIARRRLDDVRRLDGQLPERVLVIIEIADGRQHGNHVGLGPLLAGFEVAAKDTPWRIEVQIRMIFKPHDRSDHAVYIANPEPLD
jgi:hypothetical protein